MNTTQTAVVSRKLYDQDPAQAIESAAEIIRGSGVVITGEPTVDLDGSVEINNVIVGEPMVAMTFPIWK